MSRIAPVDVFSRAYEVWTRREASLDEIRESMNKGMSFADAQWVKESLEERVSTHSAAAARMLRKHVDNVLENHVDEALRTSVEYLALREMMPVITPEPLVAYQSEFSENGLAAANSAIRAHGIIMADGQTLFHGGCWPSDNPTFITTRPFSTSFCPQVALRNAEWGGKAYEADRIDLMVVRVRQPVSRAYVYGAHGDRAHEKEVVFSTGARLTRLRETYIGALPVCKFDSHMTSQRKNVSAYMIEVEIN